MTGADWKTIQIDDTFKTADQNMAFDGQLAHDLRPNEHIERFYVWPAPGITYSYKQSSPAAWHHVDQAQRITGGGLVFHTPGDIVFSMVGWNNDPRFPLKMKAKLTQIAARIRHALIHSGVALDTVTSESTTNPTYCATYPTPFEISSNGQKILGLTIRQFRTHWLVQGIVHTQPTHPSLITSAHPPIQLCLDSEELLIELTKYRDPIKLI
jgi:lipoate-protein ligase A